MASPLGNPDDTAARDRLLAFLDARVTEDELLELATPVPDPEILEACELLRDLVRHSRDPDTWRRDSWRRVMRFAAQLYDSHEDYDPAWRFTTRALGR